MTEDLKTHVRARYARHAADPEVTSLGFGDPVALAGIVPGETVLDLGSGKGGDLAAAAERAGPTGRVVGVDMTPEMVDAARHATAHLGTVSVRSGDLEGLPLPCGSVDVVISNCVINLTTDKRKVLAEAYRVLAPGGRLAVSDTAFETEPPAEIREDPEAWACCVGGALVRSDYARLLREIGFEDVTLTMSEEGCSSDCSTGEVTARAVSVTARKPGTPGNPIRPAVPADHEALRGLVTPAPQIDEAFVDLEEGHVVGVVELERSGESVLLRSLTARSTEAETRLAIAALEAARWSGAAEVHADEAPKGLGFRPEGDEMVLRFEDADLPLLGRPSRKPLPTFDQGTCC